MIKSGGEAQGPCLHGITRFGVANQQHNQGMMAIIAPRVRRHGDRILGKSGRHRAVP